MAVPSQQREHDWSFHCPEDGYQLASSPCLRLRSGFLAEPGRASGDGAWITAAYQQPFETAAWNARFDASTPVEMIWDFHTELLHFYLDDAYSDSDMLFHDDTAPAAAYLPLLNAGWTHTASHWGSQHFHSPDGMAHLEHRYGTTDRNKPVWMLNVGYPSEPLWQASFTSRTPVTYVAAFTSSLVREEPLTRAVGEVPFHTRHLARLASIPDRTPASTPAMPPAPPHNTAARTR
ncbi:DUF317 domain-containing protein [Streptomyces sp. NBC_00160]|nr:DUF317 domain-containing protein [Streptomyces sp. NBC_00160]